MKRLALGAMLIGVLLLPGVALAGPATDAALGLGAFAVFNQILSGTGIFGGAPAVVVAPPPVYYAAPPPVYYAAPAPVYVAPPPVVYYGHYGPRVQYVPRHQGWAPPAHRAEHRRHW
jgi:hypothetical protein